MQNEIAAPHDAVVSEVRVSANQTVSTGDAWLTWLIPSFCMARPCRVI